MCIVRTVVGKKGTSWDEAQLPTMAGGFIVIVISALQ